MNCCSLSTFAAVLELEGLEAGIRFLNKRVLHRFTAVYRLEDTVMRIVHVLDKEGGKVLPALTNVPLADSFCQFVIRDGGFVTSNSAQDYRLAGHKYQDVIASYVGMPLRGRNGQLWGTFCHMDLVPRPINNQELEFLQQVAVLLQPPLANI